MLLARLHAYDAREVDGHHGRDVGDAEGVSGDMGVRRETRVEHLEKALQPREAARGELGIWA